jgi:hypothetical protein
MGVEREDELQSKLVEQRAIAPHLFEYGIDQDRFLGFAAPKQIGVGRGLRVEQLPEYESHG